MGVSVPGLVGALVGLLVALANYQVVMTLAERKLRALDRSETDEERATFEGKIALMRRLILWIDVLIFPLVGFWFGRTIWG